MFIDYILELVLSLSQRLYQVVCVVPRLQKLVRQKKLAAPILIEIEGLPPCDGCLLEPSWLLLEKAELRQGQLLIPFVFSETMPVQIPWKQIASLCREKT